MRKSNMIRRGLLWLLAACMLLSGCSASDSAREQAPATTPAPGEAYEALPGGKVEGMELVCAQGELEMYVNPRSAEIAVLDCASGQLYRSNPVDADADTIATKTEKGVLRSQVVAYYFNADQNETSFSSAADAVDKEQFSLERIEGGLRVTYVMGETRSITSLMPRYITAERLQEKVYDHLDEDAIKYIAKRYVSSTTKEGFMELPPATKKSAIVVKKLAEYFQAAGYTWEDLEEDNALSGYEDEQNTVSITVPVEYRLMAEGLSARVQVSEIEVTGGVSLSGIDLLPFFGAGGRADEGYILLPAGSGALLRFNNGKQKEAVYQQQIYGLNPTTAANGRFQTSQSVRLPVFGIRCGDAAMLAVVSEGEAEGYIAADVSGRKNDWNYAFARFKLRASQSVQMSSSSGNAMSMMVFEKNIYQGPLQVNYYFLPAGAGYSEMAARYRSLLLEQGVLDGQVEESGAPLYLSVVGAIEKTMHMLGVPYAGLVTMTTCQDAAEMADRLNPNGDWSVRMRYLGWFHGGVDHQVAKSVRVTGAVGGTKALEDLSQRLREAGGCLYPDVAFQLVQSDSGNFSESQEAARTVSGGVKRYAKYLVAGMPSDFQNQGQRFFITTPGVLGNHVTGFLKDFDRLALDGLSLRDLGHVLPSDGYANRSASRSFAKTCAEDAMARLGEGRSLLIADANAYALAGAENVVDVPLESAQFYILDEGVPFYAMVVHGSVDYAGEALNLAAGYTREGALLTMLENGSAPHFLLTAEETWRMNGSVYEQWYSTCVNDWAEDILWLQGQYAELIAPLRGVMIQEHRLMDNGLRLTVYEDGTRVCINPTSRDAVWDGHPVEAMGYLILKGGDEE